MTATILLMTLIFLLEVGIVLRDVQLRYVQPMLARREVERERQRFNPHLHAAQEEIDALFALAQSKMDETIRVGRSTTGQADWERWRL